MSSQIPPPHSHEDESHGLHGLDSEQPSHGVAVADQAESLQQQDPALHAGGTEESLPTAIAVAHPIKLSLWQRILNKGGSFLVISILFHVVLLLIAATYVVQTIAAKEKLKFTGKKTLGSAGQKSLEHKVQTAKRSHAMSAPAAATRITSTASNVKVAIPDAPVSSVTSNALPSTMGGMGGSGFSGGAAGAGSAGGIGAGGAMAAMTPGAFTVFGFKGVPGGRGMRGFLYDLKMNPKKEPNENDSTDRNFGLKNILAIEKKNYDPKMLSQYYQAPQELMASRFWIPNDKASLMPQAFGVEKDVKPSMMLLHYRAKVSPPKDAYYRFVGYGDDFIAVRINGRLVMSFDQEMAPDLRKQLGLKPHTNASRKYFAGEETEASYQSKGGHAVTEKIRMEANKQYELEVFLCEWPGGLATFSLMVEMDGFPYKKIKVDGREVPIIHLFETDISQPIPEYQNRPGMPTLLPPFHPERMLWKVHKD